MGGRADADRPCSPPRQGAASASKDTAMRTASSSKAQPACAFMPIKALNQFTNDWVIKARVTKKQAIRQWSNAKSSGKLLNFDLIDRDGTAIQGTAFNETADSFEAKLQQDSVYTFSNGLVKLANKRFTSIKNDFCLTFSRDAICEPCEEDDEIKGTSFNFTPLESIRDLVQSHIVDVCGVILDVGPTSSINMRNGSQREKRSMTIGDESNVCIGVTLWGNVAEAHAYSTGQVIAFKNCRVSDYNVKSLNSSSHADDIYIGERTIRHKRGQELAAWVNGSTLSGLRDEMRNIGGDRLNAEKDGDGETGSKSKTPTLLIAQLEEMAKTDYEAVSRGIYCNINCDLSWIFVPENTERQMFY